MAVLAAGCLLKTPDPAPQLAHPQVPTSVADTESIGVTWIGHATVLIRLRDRWILTDPILGRIARVVPRNVEAGIEPKELPPLDAVLISHAHFDHLDVPSLRRIKGTNLLMPDGAVHFLDDNDAPAHQPVGLDTWETWEHEGLTITAVPASHGDGRYLVDRWNTDTHTGYVIQYQGLTVYFAGDTGYIAKDAAELKKRFSIDVALIPIGPAGRAAWIERWRADVHTTPEHAMELFTATGAQWMVPIHYDTFFKPRNYERPFLDRAIASAKLEQRVRVIGIGETTEFLY